MVVSLERWIGKVAVVTGAGGGIGAGIAEQFAIAGIHVVGLDLHKNHVEKLAKKVEGAPGKIYALQADVSKEQDVLVAFKWIKEHLGPVHILVNNAGGGKYTTLIDGETHLWKAVLDTNVLGLCIATREAVRNMRANNVNGHIFHLNSIGGHKVTSIPYLNVYSASKYAVTALTETLRQELNAIGSKIRVTSISPGTTKTGFLESGGFPAKSELGVVINDQPSMQPEDIADAIMYALGTPPHVQIHELTIIPVGGET